MTKFLLAVHVLAAIVAIGPVSVAASMFPAAVRGARPVTARVLHRICRVYAQLALVVPVFGFATASALHVLGSAWLIASLVLTTAAAAVLGLLVLPGQRTLLSGPAATATGPASEPDGLLPEPVGQASGPAGLTEQPGDVTERPADLAERPAGPAAEPAGGTGAFESVPRPVSRADTARLAMLTGVFNLLWAAVTVLMIVRPGSTTGA